MHTIKVIRSANAIIGTLKGTLTGSDARQYAQELKSAIGKELRKDFIYMKDLSDFYTSGVVPTDRADVELGKLRHELDEMGMKELFIIGGSMKTVMAVREEERSSSLRSKAMFFKDVNEATDFLSRI